MLFLENSLVPLSLCLKVRLDKILRIILYNNSLNIPTKSKSFVLKKILIFLSNFGKYTKRVFTLLKNNFKIKRGNNKNFLTRDCKTANQKF